MEEERLHILKMVEAGQIGAEEATRLLAALEVAEPEVVEEAEISAQDRDPRPEDRWARFWIYPLLAGGAVLIVGSLITGLVYAADAARAWWTRRAKWLHLRVSEGSGRKIAFSFPLPLSLAAWGLRIAQPFVPQLKETGVDDLIIALRDNATRDEPLFIDVQDGEDGERVQLYIG
jgi:hypothetical protein